MATDAAEKAQFKYCRWKASVAEKERRSETRASTSDLWNASRNTSKSLTDMMKLKMVERDLCSDAMETM